MKPVLEKKDGSARNSALRQTKTSDEAQEKQHRQAKASTMATSVASEPRQIRPIALGVLRWLAVVHTAVP